MIDSRFSRALLIVVSSAVNEDTARRCTGDSRAASLDTIEFGRPAEDSHDSEIYSLVAADGRLPAARDNIPDQCFITGNIGAFSNDLCQRAEQSVVGMPGLDDDPQQHR